LQTKKVTRVTRAKIVKKEYGGIKMACAPVNSSWGWKSADVGLRSEQKRGGFSNHGAGVGSNGTKIAHWEGAGVKKNMKKKERTRRQDNANQGFRTGGEKA